MVAGENTGINRRSALKVGAAALGTAYAAPALLKLSAAGAQTNGCYAAKLSGDCGVEAGGLTAGGDASLSAACNAVLTPLLGGATLNADGGNIQRTAGECNAGTSVTLTLPATCTFSGAGYKAGTECVFRTSNGLGITGIGTNSITITNNQFQNNPQNAFLELSHVIVVFCCNSGTA